MAPRTLRVSATFRQSVAKLGVLVGTPAHRAVSATMTEYALSYFNTARPHQGIGQRLPLPGDRAQAQVAGTVTAIPVLSGLHHDYRAAA